MYAWSWVAAAYRTGPKLLLVRTKPYFFMALSYMYIYLKFNLKIKKICSYRIQ